MKRILFVDDEPRILDGLKRTLRSMRHEWDMQFAISGAEALEMFSHEPFDIIVSDMRMPGMDGAELLSEVQRLYPDTIRLILSGHSDMEMIMKTVGPTHQYLSKPCDPDELKYTIARATSLRELLNNENLTKLVSQIENLPSMPAVYQEIVTCLQKPDASLEDISRIISKDMAMTAKILKLVNSAYFGLAKPVNSIERSVSFLGMDTITSLVLGHEIFTRYNASPTGQFSVEALWNYSTRTAVIARYIAKHEGMEMKAIDDAFMAGILHDSGRLVLAAEMPERYGKVIGRVGGQNGYSELIEREMLGAGHAEVGGYLIGLWGLPDTIVEAIACHEMPSRCQAEKFGICGVVHVASRLAADPEVTDPTECSLDVDLQYLQKAGVADHWPEWQAGCQEALEEEVLA